MNHAILFLHPYWLWLLPALVCVRLAGYALPARVSRVPSRRLRFVHPLARLLVHAGATPRRWRWVSPAVLWLVIAGLVVALAQPVRIGERLPETPRRRDIVLIVSTSVSMVLRDYVSDGKRIDRMTLLKGVLTKLVDALPNDRFGIIVYADAPYTLVPLTSDHTLITRMITRIQTVLAGRGNATGDAIALAIKEASHRPGRHTALVLFTDAAFTAGGITPQAAAALAAAAHLPVYTVAIGAAAANAGGERRTAGLIYHPANLQQLKLLASRTGARAYWASDSGALSAAVHDIAARVPQAMRAPPRYIYLPLYQWPLLAALVILALAQLTRWLTEGA